jgi:DNA-binding NarL/FixJ family response regulator
VVRDAFEHAPGFVVAAEAESGVQAVELALHYRPDVVLIEAVLPGLSGLEAVRRISERAPEVRVVVFAVVEDPDLALAALRAGASGFLSKHVPIESVARALRGVARGEAAISRTLSLRLVERLRSTSAGGGGMRPVRSNLTTREWEILDLMTTGASTRQITDELVLSEETVYSHVKSILRKLGVHTREDAIAAADRLRHPGLS